MSPSRERPDSGPEAAAGEAPGSRALRDVLLRGAAFALFAFVYGVSFYWTTLGRLAPGEALHAALFALACAIVWTLLLNPGPSRWKGALVGVLTGLFHPPLYLFISLWFSVSVGAPEGSAPIFLEVFTAFFRMYPPFLALYTAVGLPFFALLGFFLARARF